VSYKPSRPGWFGNRVTLSRDPEACDWVISYHHPGGDQKTTRGIFTGGFSSEYRFGLTPYQAAREWWRCEHVKAKRDSGILKPQEGGIYCTLWRFDVRQSWVEIPRDEVMEWFAKASETEAK
jgi:hypothetical protein